MNQKIRCKTAVSYTLLLLLLGLFLLVWPLGRLRVSHVVKSAETNLTDSGPISVQNNATQMFVAKGDCLRDVELLIQNDMYGQTMTFRLYDGSYSQIWEKFLVVDKEGPGFYRIPVNLDVTDGNAYYFTAEGLTQDLYLAYETTSDTGVPEIGTYTWGGRELPDVNVVARYRYTSKPAAWQVLLFALALSFVGFLACFLLNKAPASCFLSREVTVHAYLRILLNPLHVAITLLGLFLVFPLRKFGTGIVTYAFYSAGILLYGALGLWAINHRREDGEALPGRNWLRAHWQDALQSVFFAGALLGCVRYMNALYNYQQKIAFMFMLLFLSLAVLMMMPQKQLLHWVSPAYLVPACFVAFRYGQSRRGIPEEGETARMTAAFFVVLGLLLIHLAWYLVTHWRQMAKALSRSYAVAVGILFLALILFRNTREWPVVMAVSFGACYLVYAGWDRKERFIANLENGILLHFALAVLFMLLRRPYLSWHMYRFSGPFHTVTETAVYLTVMLCAILVRFLRRYRENPRLSHIWKELALFGIGAFYLFITLSRTGYLASAVMTAAMLLFVCGYCYRQRLRTILAQALWLTATAVCLFPVLFTAQRILPAVYDDPYIFPLEEEAYGEYVVRQGDPTDSDNYMTLPRFLRVVSVKLGGEEDTARNSADSRSVASVVAVANQGDGDVRLSSSGRVSVLARGSETASAAALLTGGPPSGIDEEPRTDISNGRIALFRLYWENRNLWGHDAMGIPDPDNGGAVTTHAHNTYLQVIHDHGLIVGAVYLLFGLLTLFRLMSFTKQRFRLEAYAALPLALFVAFATASLVEWVFFPCNPMGFAVLVSLTPLLCRFEKE